MSPRAPRKRPAAAKAPGLRHDRFVQEALRAAVIRVGEVGYAALRIEDVAQRAGVNKTSIYRRWPTKLDLIRDVLTELQPIHQKPRPDTGSLRGDLREYLGLHLRMFRTPEARGMIRILFSDIAELDATTRIRAKRGEHTSAWVEIIERGRRRGEVRAGVDGVLIADVLVSTLLMRLFNFHEKIDGAFLDRLCALVTDGAASAGPARRRRG